MERRELMDELRKQVEARVPEEVRAAKQRLSRGKQKLLNKIVETFFPTNSSGNNMSRG